MKTKFKGTFGEKLAQKFLEKKGYRLLYKNLRLKNFGEVDLIMKKGNVINFVEVKSLFSFSHFHPEVHFNKKKWNKFSRLALFYANKFGFENFILSLIAIDFYNKKIRYYENVQK